MECGEFRVASCSTIWGQQQKMHITLAFQIGLWIDKSIWLVDLMTEEWNYSEGDWKGILVPDPLGFTTKNRTLKSILNFIRSQCRDASKEALVRSLIAAFCTSWRQYWEV